ncbi:MAG TPA: histidine kinase dimerization/phosphoacceptor domain -containing protein [Balneolaceae bacterium]|nr:histidine kinase dimerization/phosphoacceptor domain -containing protein [Balneolaceae bacterium]
MSTNGNSKAKIYRVVAIFVLLGVALSAVSYFGNKIQSANRAYISGESEWAKAQKEASINLLQYLRSEDDRYYNYYMQSLRVINGDRQSREELTLDQPDIARARQGFIIGNNHPDDVDNMIWLLRNFSSLQQMQNALSIWEKADLVVDELAALADEIRMAILNGEIDTAAKDEYATRIIESKDRLTIGGQNFSGAISSLARRFDEIIFWLNAILSTIFIIIAAYFSVSYMRELRMANVKLFRSEYKFRNVLYHSRDVIYQINIGSEHYDYVSESVKDMLGIDAKEVMDGGPGMILDRVHPDDIARMKLRQIQNQLAVDEQIVEEDSEFRVKRADGTYIWVNNRRSVVHDNSGRAIAIVGNVRDISIHKQQLEKLDKSLKEKQTLLAEIHHRVKNNLAIVSSLIELQKDEVDSELKPAFENVQSRIKSIALIHEKLYEKTIFSEVELADYLRELSSMISDTYYSEEKKISIDLDLEDVKVDMTSAVPVGLICNELINNSFKHAFQNHREGRVSISLKDLGDRAEVTVSDTGKGLPDDFSLDGMNSLGVTLLQVLTQQIKGELRTVGSSGAMFVLTFPYN